MRLVQINIRVDAAFLQKLDAWRRAEPDLPNRPESVRRLVSIGLGARGKKTDKKLLRRDAKRG